MTERRPPRGLLFPVLLIALGALLLLGNLGLIPPLSWRAILSVWPLLLVVAGIGMLLGRRQPLLALGLQLGLIALGVALVAAAPTFGGWFAAPGPTNAEVTLPRDGARELSLRLNGGAGTYALSGGASALVEARSEGSDLRLSRNERRNDLAEVRLDQVGPLSEAGLRFDLFRFNVAPVDVRVRVASDVLTSLELNGGASDLTVDLRDVAVREVRVRAGASKIRLVLPSSPRGDVPVRMDVGAATVEIEVPAGVEARVTTRGGAVSLGSANPRLEARGGVAETSGYASARDRVTITVDGGATSTSIR